MNECSLLVLNLSQDLCNIPVRQSDHSVVTVAISGEKGRAIGQMIRGLGFCCQPCDWLDIWTDMKRGLAPWLVL